MTKAAIVKDVIVSTVLVLFVATPAYWAILSRETWFAVAMSAIALVVAVVLARAVYWESSLSYLVSDEGLTVRDYRGDKHFGWDEIVGIRLVPFTGEAEQYNLELKNGKTQKLHPQINDGFIDCLKFYLPQTKYWWSAE